MTLPGATAGSRRQLVQRILAEAGATPSARSNVEALPATDELNAPTPLPRGYRVGERYRGALNQDLSHDARWQDTREPGVQATVLVGKSLVVDAEQVQDRRLEVADVDRVFDDVV